MKRLVTLSLFLLGCNTNKPQPQTIDDAAAYDAGDAGE